MNETANRGSRSDSINASLLIFASLALLFVGSSIFSLPFFGAQNASVLPVSHADSSPVVFVAPDIVPPGAPVYIGGNGFSSSDSYVTIYYNSGDDSVGDYGVVAMNLYPPQSGTQCPIYPPGSGAFNCTFIAPSEPTISACDDNAYGLSHCVKTSIPPSGCVIGSNPDGSPEYNCALIAKGSTGDQAFSNDFGIEYGIATVPNSGPPGTTVTLEGTGYVGQQHAKGVEVWETELDVNFNGQMLIQVLGYPFHVRETCLPNPNGEKDDNGPFTFTVPVLPPGTYTINAPAWDMGVPDFSPSTTFTITPATITATPSEQLIGSTVSVSGQGFDPQDTSAILTLRGIRLQNATNCHISNGQLQPCTFTVPNTLPSGPFSLRAEGLPAGDTSSPTIFSVPGPYPLSLSEQSALAGSTDTVTGYAFNIGDTSVKLSLGGGDVTPSSGCPVSQTLVEGSIS